MSRGHYKGIPKDRDARIGADGTIRPLSLKHSDGVLTALDFFRVKKNDVENVKTIYARASGNDASGDGSLENPYRTFRRAAKDLPSVSQDTMWVVDISGIGLETYTERYHLPTFSSNFSDKLFISGAPAYKEFLVLSALNILATPTLIDTVSITGTSTNATTTMKSYSDSSKVWVPDEHKGRFAVGASLAEIGVIYANTEDEIFVAGSQALTGPISILEPSAELKFGPAVDSFFEGSFVIKALQSTLTMGGIKISRNSTSGALTRLEDCSASFHTLCHYESGIGIKFSGNHTFDACNIEGWAQDGSGANVRQSYVHDFATFSAHGDGGLGLDTWLGVRFERLGPIGHGGNAEAYAGYGYDKCSVVSGTSTGIDFNGGGTVKIYNTEIIDCGASAIGGTGPGLIRALNVNGSGNGGYGISITNGCQVQVSNATGVAGLLGDFKVGVLPITDWTTFNSGFKNQIDTTVISGTLSRIFNTISY